MREWGESLKTWLPEGAVRENRPLRETTTLRIGGPARLCVTIHRREDMARFVRECRREGVEWFLLGGGSNVLFSDAGFDGVVVINRVQSMETLPDHRIECGAGVSLMDLVRETISRSEAGLERLAGIPGSVGGAVVGNAGAFGQTIGDLLESVELVNESGEIERVLPESLETDYRETRLKYTKDVVLSARFRLSSGGREDLERTVNEILQLRREKHPDSTTATAGSFFKNLPPREPGGHRIAAGKILEEAGVKGLSVGDAAVFEKHANIVVNRKNARASEVLELTARMKQMAHDHAGVMLEEEVRRIGFSPEEISGYNTTKAAPV